MAKVYNSKGDNGRFSTMLDSETICVIDKGQPVFYHIVIEPNFYYKGNKEEQRKVAYCYAFESLRDLVQFFYDNIEVEKYCEPEYCDEIFKTKEDYFRWFNKLEW